MSLLLSLLLGHLLGDFVLQPLRLVLMKRRGWLGVFLHVAIVVMVTAVLLWPVLYHWWYWLCLGFLFILHVILDGSRALLWTDSENRGLLSLVVDQSLHVIVLAAIVVLTGVARGLSPTIPPLEHGPQGESLIVYLIVLVVLVWTVPVLELQARNALVGDGERLAIASRDRWLGALERIGGVALALAGFIYLAPAAFGPRPLLQREDWRDSTLRPYMFVQTAISLCSAFLCALVLISVPAPFL